MLPSSWPVDLFYLCSFKVRKSEKKNFLSSNYSWKHTKCNNRNEANRLRQIRSADSEPFFKFELPDKKHNWYWLLFLMNVLQIFVVHWAFTSGKETELWNSTGEISSQIQGNSCTGYTPFCRNRVLKKSDWIFSTDLAKPHGVVRKNNICTGLLCLAFSSKGESFQIPFVQIFDKSCF